MASDLHANRFVRGTGQILRWPTARSEAWTRAFVHSAERDGNIIAIVAVGSAVRPNVASIDLDLIVVCSEPDKLARKPPIEVDLRVYAAAEIDDLIGAGNDMLVWAVMFGHPLFQRDRYWDTTVEKWQHRLPLPSAELAIRRADEAFHRLMRVFDLGDFEAAHEQAISYLTHLARAELLRAGVYPASRPELPGQLRACDRPRLAALLETLIELPPAASTSSAQLIESLISDRARTSQRSDPHRSR